MEGINSEALEKIKKERREKIAREERQFHNFKIVIFSFIAIFTLFLFRGTIARIFQASSFSEADIRSYEELLSIVEEEPEEEEEEQEIRRTGKVVVIKPARWRLQEDDMILVPTPQVPRSKKIHAKEVEKPKLDESWYKLDRFTKAKNANEVGTVIICEQRFAKVGKYVGKNSSNDSLSDITDAAYQRTTILHIYDFKNRKKLGKHVFVTNPKAQIKDNESTVAVKPKIVQWINNMSSQ